MKASVREPAVAGMFYPADPGELRRMIEGFLAEAKPGPHPKAIIAPHAGFIYSGPIAASVYKRINPEKISRVVLIGPSHRVRLRGLAASGDSTWRTPLGEVAIERPDFIPVSDAAHAQEHSLEVQVPFLQVILEPLTSEVLLRSGGTHPAVPAPLQRRGSYVDVIDSPPSEGWSKTGVGHAVEHSLNAIGTRFTLIPLVAGDASSEEVAQTLEKLWGGPETLIVISSDLSHYENYKTAHAMDAAASKAILAFDERGLECDNACGLVPICGLLHLAKQKKMRAELVDLRSSGDTAGPRDQVVGYGAFAFYE